MSNINYGVWGEPSTWTHWSQSTNPTTEVLYGAERTGASSWTDDDFTDYPYFKITPDVNLRNLLVANKIALDSPLDNSLSYTAIANSDLPQCNRYLFNSMHHDINDAIGYPDGNPVPFSLAYYYRNDSNVSTPCGYGQLQGFDGFPSNLTIINYGKYNRFSPYADYDTTYSNVNGEYNPILRLAPVTEFGTKSIILEINVKYISSGTTAESSTLKYYLNHTALWKAAHPVVMAYCEPYFRVNKNGSYTSSINNGSMRFTGICPIFYTPYKVIGSGANIYNYLSVHNYSGTSGCFPIFGAVQKDSFNTSIGINVSRVNDTDIRYNYLSNYGQFYGADKAELHYSGTDASGLIYGTIDLTNAENIEYIMQGAAAYGLFFCQAIGTLGIPGRDTGDTERWLDPDMYCGVIREDGYTYGEYTRGTNNSTNSVYSWKKSSESTYDPGTPPTPENRYSLNTRFASVGKIDTMTKRYVLNAAGVNAMIVDMFGIMDDLSVQSTDWSELINKSIDSFLVQNPIDCIVSLKKYPVKNIPNNGTFTNIYYGRYTKGSVAGYGCEADIYTYAFKPTFIAARFGNSFLDYEPYTSAQIYIPYCGAVSLAMCDIINKTLTTVLCVDYHTGQCTGFILSDGLVIETVQGSIAVDVPVTGIQSATIESQLMQAANASRSVRINQAFGAIESVGMIGAGAVAGASQAGVSGAAIGGALAFANSAKKAANLHMQKVQADYDLTHQPAPQHIIGASSSACGWIIDSNTARLILYYPTGGVIDDANPPNFIESKLAEFGSIYGYATLESGTISSYTGLITATQMKLDIIATPNGIPATDPEIDMIRAALSEGIII